MTTTAKNPDRIKYKPVRCYRCGETFRTYTFNDVWKMRIDGKLHDVPVIAVPCMRCDTCDLSVTDAGSDEAVQWSRQHYMKLHGLNTPWLRFKRWVLRQGQRIRDRWNWYTLRFDKWRGKYPD